jgi:hypothetical protein
MHNTPLNRLKFAGGNSRNNERDGYDAAPGENAAQVKMYRTWQEEMEGSYDRLRKVILPLVEDCLTAGEYVWLYNNNSSGGTGDLFRN